MIRSSPSTQLTLTECSRVKDPEVILDICQRLQESTPFLGLNRSSCWRAKRLSWFFVLIIRRSVPVEALAFARVAVAAQPAVLAFIEYRHMEARSLIEANLDIATALVEALVQTGEMSGDEVDTIIAGCITARSVKRETERLTDWQRRQRSAAAFLADE